MAGGYPGGGKSNAVLERPQTSFRVGKAQKASSSSQLFCFFLSSQSRTDLVIAPVSGMSSKNLEIRNNKMLHIPVIPILKAHEIFLLKNADFQARPIVHSENGW